MNFAEDRYTLAQILKPSYNVQFLDGKYYYYEKENSKSLTKYSSSASSYCDFMAWKQCLHMDIPPLYKRELQKLFQDYCILSALDACMLSKLDHKLGKTEEKEIKLFLQEHDFYESKFVVDRIYYSWKVIEDRYVFMGEIPDIWRIRAIRRAVQVLSLNKFRPFLSRPEIYNIYRFIEEFTDKKYTHIKLAPGQKILLWAYKNKINFNSLVVRDVVC